MADDKLYNVIKGLAHCTRPSEVGKCDNFCMDCPYTEPIGFNQFKCNSQQLMKDALELLKERQKKEIKLHKKYIFSLKRTDEFSLRKLYEIICETLMDDGRLIISRTDDHEKVDFVWEIRDN